MNDEKTLKKIKWSSLTKRWIYFF